MRVPHIVVLFVTAQALTLQVNPIRVGHIDELGGGIEVDDAPLRRQAERLEALRKKLNERAKIRDEELAEAARQYHGSKLFETSQRIISRLRDE